MRLFYFLGGPKPGHAAQYLRMLVKVGGNPPGWRIYPLITGDGKALHLVMVDSPEKILAHLRHFDPFYEHSEIIEISEAAPYPLQTA